MKIAWIGTGVMGAPMARHLAAAGHQVTVYNRTALKAQALEPACQVAQSVGEAVAEADLIMTLVGMVSDVEAVWLGEAGLLAKAKPGAYACDLTTSSPALAQRLAVEGAQRGITVLDAPVTGGDRGAREATLSIMVGGPRPAFEALLPIFKCLGQTVTYMGGAGMGQHAKLANQLAIAGAMAGLTEALAYAHQQGIQLNDFLQVLNNGSAASWQSQNMGPRILAGDEQPGFFIKHFIKDLRLGQAARGNLDLPVGQAVLAQYEQMNQRGEGDLGTQALIRQYGGLKGLSGLKGKP